MGGGGGGASRGFGPPRGEENPEFRRNPDLPGLNSFLNYGYAIIRAAIARAIVAAGLLPSLGLHHRNRSNAFCLADDLIEPLRPLVDDRVRELHRQGHEELNQPAKAALFEILADRVQLGNEIGPLMVELHRYVASLVRCFTGEARRIWKSPRLEGKTPSHGARPNTDSIPGPDPNP